jgi:hypothetical protein
LKVTPAVGCVTWKKFAFDGVPEGAPPGLTTVTEAVAAAATSEAGTTAVNWVELKTVVTNGVVVVPTFQFTVAPGPKSVPVIVSVNAAAPGATASGDISET